MVTQAKLLNLVGIDVSAKELVVAIRRDGKDFKLRTLPNDVSGFQKLIRAITNKQRCARVCIEATGIYHLDLALTLVEHAQIEVMVANPRHMSDFAKAFKQRSKTDIQDAWIILEYAERMPFVAWRAPRAEVLELRAISRRIAVLTVERTRERCRLHAAQATQRTAPLISHDIEVNIRHLERRIEQLTRHAVDLLHAYPDLKNAYGHVTSIKGIKDTSAVQILPELLILPEDMTVKQWVAHAGLDPREHSSGSSVEKKPRISKVGNVHLRRALFMPALVAARTDTNVRAFYEKLVAHNKTPLQAIVAIMRKLLHAIYGMLHNDQDFEGEKFYALP